jgi:hypothetical protein
VLIGPPANQSAQRRFEPSAAQLTAAVVPPTTPRHSVADQRAPRPASARPRDDASASSPTFRLWLMPKGKGAGGGERWPRRRRRGVPHAPAHPGRPCVPAAPPYLSRRRARAGAPNPNRTGGTVPDFPHRLPEEKVKEEKEGGEEPSAGEPNAAKTGAARGRSRTRHEHLLPLLPLPPRRRAVAYFLFFLAGKPHRLSSPTRSTSASGHRGEDARFFPLVNAIAFEPSGTPAGPRRRAAAGDAGHRARLGRIFLQVPPPSSTCARCPPSQPPLAVGSRPVLVAAAPRRRVRVAFVRASVQAATPSRRHAPQHARTVTLETRPGLWSIFAPAPFLAVVPRKAAPP